MFRRKKRHCGTVEQQLICVECGGRSDDRAEGWEAHVVEDEDGCRYLFAFCPGCAHREFHRHRDRETG
jgi:hypothetical protein